MEVLRQCLISGSHRVECSGFGFGGYTTMELAGSMVRPWSRRELFQGLQDRSASTRSGKPRYGRAPALRRFPFFVTLLFLVMLLTGCGGGGGFKPGNVTVTVSPTAVTVPANGQTTLQAVVQGLCSTCNPAIYVWII